ncbi:ribonuclease H-like domain-containing protein [Irpex rosettiformis]|uniref:Ribonuclease H-like domain-containing protein n=1 Tax=Irpex rosettiformis TaxID=378272 RepID=A0ACB8UEI6_9APHY|nr:ribonuclease H-like domain-containing protein [Irpex rosettiformis]
MSTSAEHQQTILQPHTVFCGTVKSVKDAQKVLSTSQTIFMDCEGVELGVDGGSLSILSLGVIPPNSPQTLNIYLIDVAHLSLGHMRPVYDLLASRNVTKVVWDGRMDYSALCHNFGVRMQNVIDLQIVDILSRAERDTPEQHLERFKGYIQKSILEKAEAKSRYAKLHRLSGLFQSVKEHKPSGYEQFDKVPVDHEMWDNVRPLPAEYIKYAAMDIEMIAALYETFLSRWYITPRNTISLVVKSSRYVAFWEERPPTPAHRANFYIGNAFLPLEIIDDIPNTAPSNCNGLGRKCGRCKRMFTAASVLYTPPKPGRPRHPPYTCLVCVAVAENFGYWAFRDRAIAKRKADAAAKASEPKAPEAKPELPNVVQDVIRSEVEGETD